MKSSTLGLGLRERLENLLKHKNNKTMSIKILIKFLKCTMYEIINPVSFNADTDSVNVFCSGSKNTSPNNYFFSIRGNSNRNPVYS